MGLRDMLKKKHGADGDTPDPRADAAREFTFIRTDTSSQEIIHPPSDGPDHGLLSPKPSVRTPRRSLDVFRSSRSRSASLSSENSHSSRRRISERLHLGKQHVESSEHVPGDLPAITTTDDPTDQSQWEARATILAAQNEAGHGRSESLVPSSDGMAQMSLGAASPGGRRGSPSSSKAIDEDIQEAIRLHEDGDFQQATKIFGRLANLDGPNNPLSQVLYGLALRHGWGCEPDPAEAVKYLRAAASNSAAVEELALRAGMKKGGAAKGELVLAIFELANCFRHGWGIQKDPFAAKHYYETAANLGDSDAMNEVAWCYLEGFGCKTDKKTAARYYRLAENAGNKIIGNSWIWKEKYNP